VSWGLGKLSYSLDAFDSLREYQVSESEDRTRGVTAGVSYRMAPKTRVTGSLGLTRYEVSAATVTRVFATAPRPDRDDDVYKLTVGVDHQFDPELTGGLTYQHQHRDSNIANGDFTENRITATVSMSF
jgi:uncharacterized protein (PEP-CTERM system associated)